MSASVRHLPSILALRAFEATARLGSIRKAALALGTDHSSVSRHLASLQAQLGVRLIQPSPSGVELTQEGKRYAERVRSAIKLLETATSEVVNAGRPKSLEICCVPGFGVRWLAQRLPRFSSDHTDVQVVLRPTDKPPSLANGEADIDIRYGPHAEPRTRSIELLQPRFYPVASETWIKAHGGALTLKSVAQASLLHEETEAHWRLWLASAGLKIEGRLPGPLMWQAHMAIEAAKAGQGIALANDLLVRDELANHQLVEVLETNIVLEPYTFTAQRARWEEPLIAAFRTWLKNEFEAWAGSRVV